MAMMVAAYMGLLNTFWIMEQWNAVADAIWPYVCVYLLRKLKTAGQIAHVQTN